MHMRNWPSKVNQQELMKLLNVVTPSLKFKILQSLYIKVIKSNNALKYETQAVNYLMENISVEFLSPEHKIIA